MDYKMLQGDCIRNIKMLEDGSIDAAVMDPPYCSGGLSTKERQASTGTKYTERGGNGAARFKNFSGDNMDQRAFTRFMREVFMCIRPKLRSAGVVCCFIDWRNLPALSDALQMAGFVWRGVAVWDKKNSRPQRGRFRNQCEYIVWGSAGALPADRGVPPLPGVFEAANVATSKRHHQTEKPVGLMEKIIGIVPEGATVLDPFAGSGSTGVACMNTGRDFIGIELDKDYAAVASQRIEDAREMAEKEKPAE